MQIPENELESPVGVIRRAMVLDAEELRVACDRLSTIYTLASEKVLGLEEPLSQILLAEQGIRACGTRLRFAPETLASCLPQARTWLIPDSRALKKHANRLRGLVHYFSSDVVELPKMGRSVEHAATRVLSVAERLETLDELVAAEVEAARFESTELPQC